jgi:phosphate/sulfate permease
MEKEEETHAKKKRKKYLLHVLQIANALTTSFQIGLLLRRPNTVLS